MSDSTHQTHESFLKRLAEIAVSTVGDHKIIGLEDVARIAAIGVLPMYPASKVLSGIASDVIGRMTHHDDNDGHLAALNGEKASAIASTSSAKRLIPWGATVSREFVDSVLWIENQIGLKPENVMPCMKFESNLNPAARNTGSSATGLIQFMEATAQRLGTTTALLVKMDAVKQLSYVFKYFKEYHDRGFKLNQWTLEDTYMSILWPAGIGKPLDYEVFNKAKGYSAYSVNRGLDNNNDGHVTKKEACARVVALFHEGSQTGNALLI